MYVCHLCNIHTLCPSQPCINEVENSKKISSFLSTIYVSRNFQVQSLLGDICSLIVYHDKCHCVCVCLCMIFHSSVSLFILVLLAWAF